MEIRVETSPSISCIQSVLFFQFQFMEWKPDELETEVDRYGSEPFGYVIAEEDRRIIGVVNILKRDIVYHNRTIRLGGIGGVCVRDTHKRKGVATALLKVAVEELQKVKCDVAYLCTDLETLSPLYGSVGFVPLCRAYTARGASGAVYSDTNGMIAPICSHDVFEEILHDSDPFDLQGQDW